MHVRGGEVEVAARVGVARPARADRFVASIVRRKIDHLTHDYLAPRFFEAILRNRTGV